MEKLAKLGWQKLIIIAAALDIVLGIIFGAIFKAVPAGIIVGVLAAAVTGVIVFALGGGVVAGHTKGDKYKKLFMNLPIGFAQAKIITDSLGNSIGYCIQEANERFGSYFNLDASDYQDKILGESKIMTEEDFMSAEIEVVPAGHAREAGLDHSMVMSYGQDDRVCAYTSLAAMLEVEEVEKTTCCLLTDKEEIGSVGATGMQSRFFENSVAELMDAMGEFSELSLRRCLANSSMLSSDVNAAYDPLFANAFEKNNASYFGRGVVFSKFTGSRGKSGSNDANAEYIARIRKMMDKNEVCFQTAELGKVDVGGGGTIAYILSLYGMEVIDCGVAVLNMHAPWEITSKADIYEAYKCYKVFLKEA